MLVPRLEARGINAKQSEAREVIVVTAVVAVVEAMTS